MRPCTGFVFQCTHSCDYRFQKQGVFYKFQPQGVFYPTIGFTVLNQTLQVSTSVRLKVSLYQNFNHTIGFTENNSTQSLHPNLAFSNCTISCSDFVNSSGRMILSKPALGITLRWKSYRYYNTELRGYCPSHVGTFIVSLPLSCRLAPLRRSSCLTKGPSPSRDTAMDRADKTAFLMKPPVSSKRRESSSC